MSTKRASFFRFRRNDLAKSRDFCKALNFWLLFFQEKVTEDQHVAKNKGQFKQIKQF
jgi:hypothetical protein